MAKLKTVKAWAVVRIVDGREKFDTAFEHKHDAESHMYDVFCPTEVKVVRIVPEAEYKRMMAAVKVAEWATSPCGAKGGDRETCDALLEAYNNTKRKAVKRGK